MAAARQEPTNGNNSARYAGGSGLCDDVDVSDAPAACPLPGHRSPTSRNIKTLFVQIKTGETQAKVG
jgi:hypothetical protein